MGLETLDEAFDRLGTSRSAVVQNLKVLNQLNQSAKLLISGFESGLHDAYDFRHLSSLGYTWVRFRGRVFPAKDNSRRYMPVESARKLHAIELSIRSIDDSYDPLYESVLITRVRKESAWVDVKGDLHCAIG